MTLLRALILSLTISLGGPAIAKDAPFCETFLDPFGTSQKQYGTLSFAKAMEIIGEGTPGEKIKRALNYLSQHPNLAVEHKAANLLHLCATISNSTFRAWSYEQFFGADISVGVYGEIGDNGNPFIIIRKDGRIFRGLFQSEIALNRNFQWDGSFLSLTEVRP